MSTFWARLPAQGARRGKLHSNRSVKRTRLLNKGRSGVRRGDTRGSALTQANAEGEDGDARADTCACMAGQGRAGPEASSPGVPQGPQLRPSRLSCLRLTAASHPAERSLSAPFTWSLRQGGPCQPPGRPAPSPRQPPHMQA